MAHGRLSATHLNGNLLCAIDVETTGIIPGYHDIIQLAILPLDASIKPLKMQGIRPFYLEIVPKLREHNDPRASGVTHLQLAEIIARGVTPDDAEELLRGWFEKLGLPENKKISPLAQNWPFDRSFIMEWLGQSMFEELFDGRYRDTMSAALFCNDMSDWKAEEIPYKKVNLGYLASTLKVEQIKAHDALSDCVTTSEVYRRMMGYLP